MEKIGIGIWGAGVWAKMSARAMLETSEFQVVTCYDPDKRNREAFSAETGCEVSESEESFLGFPGLDAVAIFTPNFLHVEHAVRAFESGHHVFVEKPMANTSSDSNRIIDASNKADRVLFVGHNTRREGRFRRIESLLERGVVGIPVMADITFTSSAGLNKDLGSWRYNPDLCPAVALAQIGVHAIDVLHYLFGEVRETQAWIKNVGMEGGIEDVCLGRMEHPSGFSSTLATAYSVPRVRSLRILGTGGEINTAHEKSVLLKPLGAEEAERIEIKSVDTVLEEFQEFAECCRGERAPETDGAVGLAAVAVMEAMIQSSKENSSVQQPGRTG